MKRLLILVLCILGLCGCGEVKKENVVKEIKRASDDGISNAQQLFMKMWIYIHGAGCMAVTGDYDLDEATSVSMLESAYKAFSL